MIAFMPSESANSSPGKPIPTASTLTNKLIALPGVNYWYGNSLPDGLPQDGNNPRMLRRASEAVIHSHAFHR